MSTRFEPTVTAVLGPTNTGKTHLAIDRMCGHSSGMIGFPLRLLAREVYDRVVAMKGANRVALVTGEEKIVPADARWFCCTAEAMPMQRDLGFVAIDEAQLGIDRERGHVFTDRMLRARGRDETMILGSAGLRPLVSALVPEAEITTRPRFSTLSYAGPRKLNRLPRRSAIVAFSVEDVYAIAEMLRRHHGGAAIVMGSLSPQTRNAQVEMFQAGEVDYLVATDAIGMGLNLDVGHVALASLRKFDGRRRRRLTLSEIAQIAGRAGRHQKDGTFGTLTGAHADDALTEEEIARLEAHEFPSLDWLYWRNPDLDFDGIDALLASLAVKPAHDRLQAAEEAVDVAVLRRLGEDASVRAAARPPDAVRLLWEAASIPDFRKVGADHHARFAASIFGYLQGPGGAIPHAKMATEVARLESRAGDIATLAARIAAARTWSYIAQKPGWTERSDEMIERTRALERDLSDAMHVQLTQRFVDKRSRVLMRGLAGGALPQDVGLEDDGRVLVEGLVLGTLKGFHFAVPSDSRRGDRKLLLNAAERYLGGIMTDKADALSRAPDSVLSLRADGEGRAPALFWGDDRLGVLTAGSGLLKPAIRLDAAVRDMAPDNVAKVEARVRAFVDAAIEKHLGGIAAIDAAASDPATPAPVRALFAQVAADGGIVARAGALDTIRALGRGEGGGDRGGGDRDSAPDARTVARKAGLVFGALDIFHHAALKPGAVLWRGGLLAARGGAPMPPPVPDNAVRLGDWEGNADDAARLGFRRVGDTGYVRVDMVERLLKQAHEARGKNQGAFALDRAMATSLGLSEAEHDALLKIGGFVAAEEPASESPAAPESTEPAPESAAPEPEATGSPADAAPEPEAPATPEPPRLSWWRWKGLGGRSRPQKPSGSPGKSGGDAKKNRRGSPDAKARPKPARKPEPVLASAKGAFADLAALRDQLKK